jgi:hypothetical protein
VQGVSTNETSLGLSKGLECVTGSAGWELVVESKLSAGSVRGARYTMGATDKRQHQLESRPGQASETVELVNCQRLQRIMPTGNLKSKPQSLTTGARATKDRTLLKLPLREALSREREETQSGGAPPHSL